MQPIIDRREAALALKFTLSLPITTILPSGEDRLFPMILDVMRTLGPLTPKDRNAMKHLVSTLAPINTAF